MVIFFSIIVIIIVGFWLYIRQDKFGKASVGDRLKRLQGSAHFKNGKFQNIHETPQLTEGYSMLGVMYKFLLKKNPRRKPIGSIPTIKTNLLDLPADKDVLVWFGHSSYFMQVAGKKILVDPVFSGNASPLPGTNKSFKGADIYTVDDLPHIDYLFISHDHYDHLDYLTIMQLKPKVAHIICGLGVGAHFERWGYESFIIQEYDWYEKAELGNGFIVHVTPARHFSGRGFVRNNTLWVSFVLQTPTLNLFIGGDSGYDTHFAAIGEQFGPFDLAILENGQYDQAWHFIHTLPEEVLQAAKDLKAKRVLPVHSGKFAMGNHAWDEPLVTITELNKNDTIPLITPVIGEVVNLHDGQQLFGQWWANI